MRTNHFAAVTLQSLGLQLVSGAVLYGLILPQKRGPAALAAGIGAAALLAGWKASQVKASPAALPARVPLPAIAIKAAP